MPRAMELISGRAVAPSTNATALTPSTGNTFTVRNFAEGSRAYLLQAWADVQGAGTLRIRSPFLHDLVQGIRLDTLASDPAPLIPDGVLQQLQAQDSLTADITGSATAGDVELAALLLYYEDLGGISARLASPEDVMNRIEHLLTVENTLALGTGGDYSGEEALDAEFDLLRANRDYAILGYLVDAECAAVRYRGSDLGNMGIGGPGADDRREMTKNWFVNLSKASGLPCIPIVNAANKSSLLIDGLQDENGTDVTVTTILAQLGSTA